LELRGTRRARIHRGQEVEEEQEEKKEENKEEDQDKEDVYCPSILLV